MEKHYIMTNLNCSFQYIEHILSTHICVDNQIIQSCKGSALVPFSNWSLKSLTLSDCGYYAVVC